MMTKNHTACVDENKRWHYIFVHVISMMFIKQMCEIYTVSE